MEAGRGEGQGHNCSVAQLLNRSSVVEEVGQINQMQNQYFLSARPIIKLDIIEYDSQ